MNSANYQLQRPPEHEKVSEDLIIYALPHWKCPSFGSSENCDNKEDSSGIAAWTMFALLGMLWGVALFNF